MAVSLPGVSAFVLGSQFSAMTTFFAGTSYPLRALGVLSRHPALWKYIIVPVLLNVLIGATLYAGLLFAGLRSIDALIAGLPEWVTVIAWLLRALLVVALLIATGYLLVRFGVVIGSPFYSRLSERLEEHRSGVVFDAPPPTVGNVTRDIARAILFEIKKLMLALLIGAPTLLLNLIPVVGRYWRRQAALRLVRPFRASTSLTRRSNGGGCGFARNWDSSGGACLPLPGLA